MSIKSIYTAIIFAFVLVTPAKAQVNHVVIGALYGGGSNSGAIYANDFIELFNPTDSSISMENYSVQYAPATTNSWKVQPISAIMPAGSYYLIQLSGSGAVGDTLSTADVIGTINMSATTGKVALVNTITALPDDGIGDSTAIDLVGYGPTASGYETNPAPALTAKKCLVRASNGCTDIGDNSSDFSTSTTFVPQNSLSPLNICGGLPVSLISFTADIIDNNADLIWQTTSEINFNRFVIEKSTDATTFYPIATILAEKLVTGSDYQFKDASIFQGKEYYRLRMIDNNGSFRYSKTITLEGIRSSINKIIISPNPVVNTLFINHPKATIGAFIKISTVDGRVVLLKAVAIGTTQTNIDVSGFAKSNYFVSYENEGTRVVSQFVKE